MKLATGLILVVLFSAPAQANSSACAKASTRSENVVNLNGEIK